MNLWHDALVVAGVVVLGYFAALNLILLIFTATAWRQVNHHARARVYGGAEEAFSSPLTPAISVLVPAYNEEASIVESVRSLVRLRYPQHEVIVVNDGSTDEMLTKLKREFDLVAVRKVLRDTIPVQPVRAVYVSRRHPDLVVIDKENGGKADALNAALMVARHPYVCAVDADALLEEDALLSVAKPILDDPERTVATGGIVRIANGCWVEDGTVKEVGLPRSRVATFQVVEYFRAFLIGRVGWSNIDSLLIISGAFGLFRRSTLEAVGGYWTGTVGEDVELVVRLHRYFRERGEDYRMAFVPDPVCWTEVPEDMGTLIRQRRRWQRGLGEALWRHRAMIGRRRYGTIGLVATPYFVVFELLGPVIELLGLAVVVPAVLLGQLSTSFLWAGLILSILLGSLLSIAALALEEFSFRRHRRGREVGRALAYAVLENFGFRQLMTGARLLGLLDLVRRPRHWGFMRRNGLGRVQSADEAARFTEDGMPGQAPDRRRGDRGSGGAAQPPPASRRFRVVVRLLMVGEVAGAVAWVVHATARGGDAQTDGALLGWAHPALYLLPAGLCLARGWVGRGERLAWLSLGAGQVLAGAAWLDLSLLPGGPHHMAPALLRVALGSAFYALSAAGLVLLLRSRMPDRRQVGWLDGLVAALTLASVTALVLLESTGDLTARAAAVSTLLDAGWLAAACLIGYAASRDPGARRAAGSEATILLLAPLFFAFAALVVIVSGGLGGGQGAENHVAILLASAALVASLVRGGVGSFEQRRLRAAAFVDPLSGLMNYSGFHSLIENEIERAQRSGRSFSVVTFGLDGLKQLNDLRGHREGDRVLRRLADAIRAAHRSADVPARTAGAEFAVVLPNTSGAGARAAAQRVQGLIADLGEPVGVSVGIAEWPTDGPGKERLLRRAGITLHTSARASAPGLVKAGEV